MKKLQILIGILLVLSIINNTGCTDNNATDTNPVHRFNMDTLSFQHSMKGWELYSWPSGNDWNFSILPGSNRITTYSEVTTNLITVSGSDSLKMLLDKFPENEEILWPGTNWLDSCWKSNYGNLSLPDSNKVNEIKAYSIQKKLILTVCN